MKTEATAIKVAKPSGPEHEILKTTRKGLKTLQQSAVDKENLAGRAIVKDAKMAVDQETKKRKLIHKAVQTEDQVVSEADLVSDEPSESYWKRLAEKRQEDLDKSLQEIEHLKDHIEGLKEENRIASEMLDESKALVEVLQEMLNENETAEAPSTVEAEEED